MMISYVSLPPFSEACIRQSAIWTSRTIANCVDVVPYVAGITGTVSIDANGDRNADYSLLDMNPENDKFEVRAMHQPTTVNMTTEIVIG